MRNKERILLIGILRRFNNFFGPRDLEIVDHKRREYGSDTRRHYRAIRRMTPQELKKEVSFQMRALKVRRTATKKDRGIEDYINFLTD